MMATMVEESEAVRAGLGQMLKKPPSNMEIEKTRLASRPPGIELDPGLKPVSQSKAVSWKMARSIGRELYVGFGRS